jgi:tetratricopeptide (TPR) repeat protein
LFSEAIPHYEKGIELDDSQFGLGSLGHAYAKSGRVDEAHAVLERLDELANSRYVAPTEKAYVYAGLGDLDRSFEWLEKAYDERSGDLPFARAFPIGKDLEHDPRFSDLMRRIGLEE